MYTVVYARGAAHLQGLAETPRDYGTENAPAYTMSACAALSKRMAWCNYWQGEDLAEAMQKLESCGKYRATGVCKKCTKTGNAQLEAIAKAEK